MDLVFANDIRKGLTALHKYIPDRQYYYDERGSLFFQKLMKHPDYYVTTSELSIFNNYKKIICEQFIKGAQEINIIEFGAGDAQKTKILLSECNRQKVKIHYIAIDFSKKYLNDIVTYFWESKLNIDLKTIHADYFDAIKELKHFTNIKSIILFVGNSLGEFSDEEISTFFSFLSKWMQPKDILLLGLDLKKMPDMLYRAYHDTCKDWSYYLLQRINNELQANFNLTKFEYYTVYDPEKGIFKWFFISKCRQSVDIPALKLTIDFEKGESINMGQSRKFSVADIQMMAQTYLFDNPPTLFFDNNHLFVDVLFRKR